MKETIQKFLFDHLSLKNYLRVLQRSHLLLYKLNILKFSKTYSYHYLVKRLIKKGDIVIDIGSNLGYYSVPFSKWVGKNGHVYSVEPIPLYNKIHNEISHKRTNVTIIPYALGIKDEEVEMVNPLHNGYLRTGLPHVYEEHRDGNIHDIQYKFKVMMKNPTSLFSDLHRIDYIKCDIEGFEYFVLSQMVSLIEKFKPIIQVEIWENNDLLIKKMLKELGYNFYYFKNSKLEQIKDGEKISSDYILIHEDKVE